MTHAHKTNQETTQTHFSGGASVPNAVRAGSWPHESWTHSSPPKARCCFYLLAKTMWSQNKLVAYTDFAKTFYGVQAARARRRSASASAQGTTEISHKLMANNCIRKEIHCPSRQIRSKKNRRRPEKSTIRIRCCCWC